MVLHDYKCNKCELIFESVLPFEQKTTNCVCGGTARRIVSPMRKAQTDIFEPYREENLGDDCPLVTSKQHLAKLCKERGLVSRRLVDGYRNYGSGREI